MLGPRSVIVTFGEAGAAWICDGRGAMIDACRVQSVDTVGAGDSFCGAIAATWPRGAQSQSSTVTSLQLAAAAGALATTKAGAIPSLPIRSSVEDLWKRSYP